MILKLIFSKLHPSTISTDSPDWFKVYDDKILKDINNGYVKNGESLHILSKFHNWITVTPNKKDRNHPLEKQKIVK